MGLVPIEQLKPEMILADDLRDRNGRFLLPRGKLLTARQIRMLKMWGVIDAEIEGDAVENVEQDRVDGIDPAIMEEAERAILERFSHADVDHPAIQELLRPCTMRKAMEIAGTDPGAERGKCPATEHRTDAAPEQVEPGIDFLKYITGNVQLPTLPSVFIKINETIKNPKSSARDIADVISKDTSLSARLLKVANSAFYGFPSRIDTLSRAVSIVGTKQLSNLAFGIKIIGVFDHIASDIIDMKSFWKHSVACGVIARILASFKNMQNTERLFVAGLLHDIGRLILYDHMPGLAVCTLKKADEKRALLFATEREIMNIDHAQIGGGLLRQWKLPLLLENIVTCHHAPEKSQNQLECSIVHLADIMTNAVGIGSSGERFVPSLDREAWECIGLSPHVVPSTLNQSDRQIEEILQFFCSDG